MIRTQIERTLFVQRK